jgi:hypothetical protein
MTETLPIWIFAAVLAVCATVLCIRVLNALTGTFGQRIRGEERERTRLMQMVEKMVEKRDCSPVQAASIHAQERVEEARLQARTEQKAGDSNNRPLVPDEVCGPMEALEDADTP